MAKPAIKEGSEGDGEQVDCDVFEGEEATKDESACESKAEGVDCGLWDETRELDEQGRERSDHRQSARVECWEESRDEPVEGYRPEKRASVLEEEPRQAEGKGAPCNAERDGDDKQGDTTETAVEGHEC